MPIIAQINKIPIITTIITLIIPFLKIKIITIKIKIINIKIIIIPIILTPIKNNIPAFIVNKLDILPRNAPKKTLVIPIIKIQIHSIIITKTKILISLKVKEIIKKNPVNFVAKLDMIEMTSAKAKKNIIKIIKIIIIVLIKIIIMILLILKSDFTFNKKKKKSLFSI
jgi:hypothetical protein